MKRPVKILFLMLNISIIGISWAEQCYGQSDIHGRLLDEENHLPIDLAHIVESGHQRAVISNEWGEFIIGIDSFPVVLSFSHLGFETRSIQINENPNEVLTIIMRHSEQQLKEVIVVGDKVQYFFKEESFYVKDLEFGDGFIWVVGYPEKEYNFPQLRILSLAGDTKASLELSQQGELFQDAFGEVHLLEKDSIFQLYNLQDSIVT
ncbi:MAG: carboxypeptidase-like regulatory domain-containing protein, partial [Bacteroidales bacterium]|nr:carboxypeptidase-like regulatory domain-containing protein [Bacteroidales bacterium]